MCFINKKTLIVFIILVIAMALVLGTCFSPYGADMGDLTVSIGNSSRAIIPPGDEHGFEHEVILIGSGGTYNQTFTGTGTARFTNIMPGSYSVIVRAVGDNPGTYTAFPSRMLRAYGLDIAQIRAGRANDIYINMLPATEVTSEAQFRQALLLANDPRGEYIVIKEDIEFASMVTQTDPIIVIDKKITLIAEENVTLSTQTNTVMFHSTSAPGHLELGAPGMRGQLVLDGMNVSYSMIIFYNNARLTMHNNVILQGTTTHSGVESGGLFEMFGGIISGTVMGVYVFGGTFDMYDGVIRNNDHSLYPTNNGAGVNVVEGIFNMYGGTISGNTAGGFGGGVYIDADGIFKKTGGTIFGHEAGANRNYAGSGQGHAVYVALRPVSGSITYRAAKARDTTAGPNVHLDSESTNW